jgi:uncharacterized protein YwqG
LNYEEEEEKGELEEELRREKRRRKKKGSTLRSAPNFRSIRPQTAYKKNFETLLGQMDGRMDGQTIRRMNEVSYSDRGTLHAP